MFIEWKFMQPLFFSANVVSYVCCEVRGVDLQQILMLISLTML
jgi:hypothetical protein